MSVNLTDLLIGEDLTTVQDIVTDMGAVTSLADDLVTTSITAGLTANQGVVIKSLIDNLQYILSVADDSTPELGGDLDAVNHRIDNVKIVTFDSLGDNGIKTAAWTYNPAQAQYQEVTINADCTMTIVAPTKPCTSYLHIHQGTIGGTLTTPTGKWPLGIIKVNSLAANTGHDLLMCHWTGVEWIFDMMQSLG